MNLRTLWYHILLHLQEKHMTLIKQMTFDQAEQQRQIAEHQRIQAELSKRKTDTLSFISLGRSLGSMALTQYHIGNLELSDLLSYASPTMWL